MRLWRNISYAVVFGGTLVSQEPVYAGMPSPYLVVTELGKRRLEEISFFLIGFLSLTAICRWFWNGLAKDFTFLPRLSYRGALGLMFLWGLALTVVLSLVSGARELMTPAAWEPNGITHRLAESQPKTPFDELTERRRRLESLQKSLWDYAAQHDTRFPNDIFELPRDLTMVDAGAGLRYFLQPDLTTSSARTLLVSEPDIYPKRLQLMTDGSIVVVERSEGHRP